MSKILIIEDEIRINNMIADYLKHEGFEVIQAFDGIEGVFTLSKEHTIDLVILDVMLPNLDGFSALKAIRRKHNMPVIMVTAKGNKEDVLKGYSLRADDYIIKPFNIEILVAKVKVLLDRINSMNDITTENWDDCIEIKGIKINRSMVKAYIDNEEIQLEKKQFEILQYFMENKNIVISRENILDNIWGVDHFGNDRVVDAQIKKLRKSLKHKSYLIKTVFGVGYKFDE